MAAPKSKYLADFEEEMRDGDILVPEHRPCYSFHATGVCKFRAKNLRCDFVHNHIDYKNSRKILDMQPVLCADFINGYCKMGDRCFNIHNMDFRRMKIQNNRARAAARAEADKEKKHAIKDIQEHFSKMQAQAMIRYDDQVKEMRMISEKKAKEEVERMQEEQQRALIAWNASLDDSTYSSMSSPNPSAPVKPFVQTEPISILPMLKEAVFGKEPASLTDVVAKRQDVHTETAPTPSSLTRAQRIKENPPKKICQYFKRGECKFGDSCFRSHGEPLAREIVSKTVSVKAKPAPAQSKSVTKTKQVFRAAPLIKAQSLVQNNPIKEVAPVTSREPVVQAEPVMQTKKQTPPVINAKPVTDGKPATQTAQATPVNQTESKVQQPRKKGRKNQKKKKAKLTVQVKTEANTTSVQATEQTDQFPAKADGDEHASMENDGWVVTKRVNSAWSKSTKNFPALPSPSEKTQMKFPSTVTISVGSTSGKTSGQSKSMPTTSSRKVFAPAGRRNGLVGSSFPPLAGGQPSKKAQLSSAGSRWSKPLIPIPEHPVKGTESDMWKNQVSFGSQWDPRDAIFTWATENLAPEKQLAYLKNYFAPKKEHRVVKYDSAAHELYWKGRTQFSDLPYEIRHMIWDLVLKDRAGTCARLKLVCEHVEKDGVISDRSILRRYSSQPLLLRLNHESRVFALKHYEHAFATADSQGMTYFNFDRDRLHLDTHGFNVQALVDVMRPEDRDRVKVVAISIKDWLRCDSERELCHQIARFRNLKRWFLIAGDGRHEQKYLKDRTFMRYAMSILKRECHKLYGPRNDWGNWNGVHTIPDSAIPRFGWKVVDVDTARHLKIDDIRW